jgi:hypothetical protein
MRGRRSRCWVQPSGGTSRQPCRLCSRPDMEAGQIMPSFGRRFNASSPTGRRISFRPLPAAGVLARRAPVGCVGEACWARRPGSMRASKVGAGAHRQGATCRRGGTCVPEGGDRMRGDQAAVGAMEELTGDLVAGGLPCQRGSSKKLCGVARCDRMECYPRRCVCAMSVSG